VALRCLIVDDSEEGGGFLAKTALSASATVELVGAGPDRC
jgi:hypothetical protein